MSFLVAIWSWVVGLFHRKLSATATFIPGVANTGTLRIFGVGGRKPYTYQPNPPSVGTLRQDPLDPSVFYWSR